MSARGQRFEAKQFNKPYYWTGQPCKNGHVAFRMTSTGTCLECRRQSDREKYAESPDVAIAKRKKYYAQLPADVVAALGNGSNKAGAEKLYQMMHNIRREHRKGKPEDLPAPAKSPLQYMRRAS